MSSGFDPVPSDRLEVTAEAGAALTDFDYRVAASLLKLTKSLRLPKDTLSYLVDYLSLNQPVIPVSQLSGFTQFLLSDPAQVTATETTTSTTYVNLTTNGPELTGLPNGIYAIFFGCLAKNSLVADESKMSISVNAGAADDADQVIVTGTTFESVMIMRKKTLSSGNSNTVTAKYRVSAGTGSFADRWLTALKIANL